MQTRTRHGLLLMMLAAILLAFANTVRCQELPAPIKEIKHPPHKTALDFWDSVRVLPIRVNNYDFVTGVVDYVFEDDTLIRPGQFQVTTTTKINAEIKKGGNYLVAYCGANHGEGLNERIKYLIQIEK